MSSQKKSSRLEGKDLITIGIYTVTACWRNNCHYRSEWRWKIYSGPLYLRTGKEVWLFAG